MATPSGDKYRDYLSEEELKTTHWRYGPPNFEEANKLFEQGRTKIWPVGCLEEKVQRLIMTFEMELVHKANHGECKSFDPKTFTLSVRGRKPLMVDEIEKIGGYNVFMQTDLPKKFRVYDTEIETAESTLVTFKTAFPRGFNVEVLQVYSGPPVIVYKYRHWAYMEGSFKEYHPTGDLVELHGIASLELDGDSRLVKMETFMDLGPFFECMVKT